MVRTLNKQLGLKVAVNNSIIFMVKYPPDYTFLGILVLLCFQNNIVVVDHNKNLSKFQSDPWFPPPYNRQSKVVRRGKKKQENNNDNAILPN